MNDLDEIKNELKQHRNMLIWIGIAVVILLISDILQLLGKI